MTVKTDDMKTMIERDPDYVASKRFGYSLTNLLKRHPDGCPDRIIANVLMITEDELDLRYEKIVQQLRDHMGVKKED